MNGLLNLIKRALVNKIKIGSAINLNDVWYLVFRNPNSTVSLMELKTFTSKINFRDLDMLKEALINPPYYSYFANRKLKKVVEIEDIISKLEGK